MHNQTPKWLTPFITAFGAQGLVALAWWAGAFHAQRIRELQATYPILQITGGAGVGKSTLVANLWKLAGSSADENRRASTCSMGALLAFLARAVNRPVVLEDTDREADNFDWKTLRECYDSSPIAIRRSEQPVNALTFQGALAFVGGETEVINRRIVNIHLVRGAHTDAHREAMQALNGLLLADMVQFVETVHSNREQVVYRLGHVAAYVDGLQWDMDGGLNDDAARNHAQLRALLDLLGDLFHIEGDALQQAHSQVSEMAWQHANRKAESAALN